MFLGWFRRFLGTRFYIGGWSHERSRKFLPLLDRARVSFGSRRRTSSKMILENLVVNSSFAAFALRTLPSVMRGLFGPVWVVRRLLRGFLALCHTD